MSDASRSARGSGIQKGAYVTPRLVQFGEVRNLTGGSATMMIDGAVMMAATFGMMGMT